MLGQFRFHMSPDMTSIKALSLAQQLQADADQSDTDNSAEPGQSGSAGSELDGDEDDAALEAAMFASDNEQDLSEEEEQGVPPHVRFWVSAKMYADTLSALCLCRWRGAGRAGTAGCGAFYLR